MHGSASVRSKNKIETLLKKLCPIIEATIMQDLNRNRFKILTKNCMSAC